MTIDELLQTAPVIPVLVLDGGVNAAALAETLVGSGLPVIEVTLRTPFALDAIRSMATVDGAIVGAGTVLNEHMLDEAMEAGARFIVSPGLTEALTKAASAVAAPILPGVATASEIMRGLDLGLDRFKFFPAEAAGGLNALSALAAPFGKVQFCPTGGIREDTAAEWLSHPAVACVGGSWIARQGENDLAAIRARARQATKLRAALVKI